MEGQTTALGHESFMELSHVFLDNGLRMGEAHQW